ncbi:glycoside hydrolase family 2 protein [Plebeiibacterium sediminum]|uniref:Beta-galactosidase n=1 Tax=Plebeiibacterium sediminum TaxID=2992112 RepID=A0AAE3M7C6_9BACT|nr:sugar-binding domain-containing protein [Plebeiobacterium sediminum]MCW3787885.1 hypothetical protein [Plebeiobacterium sediminum]
MTNKILFLSFLILSFTLKSHSQTREVQSLDGAWIFALDSANIGFESNWEKGIPTDIANNVIVPHTWNLDKESEEYVGWAWYEKEFNTDRNWKNKVIRLKFDAVYHDAIVYINGKKLGENKNAGYTSFSFDITKYISFNQQNKIVVAVNNDFSKTNFPYNKAFDWVNDGGITRSVNLILTGKPSLQYVHVKPAINLNDSTGNTSISIKLWEKNISNATFSFAIKDKSTGAVILSETKTLKAINGKFQYSFKLGKIKPWHFDAPNLYELQTTVINKESSTDEKTVAFGFRDIKIKDEHLYLNGEIVRLPGIEYMPGSSTKYGITEPRSYMDSIVRTMKDLNVCITRFHWPQDEYMLSLMDQYGILVQEELPWWQRPAKLSPELIQSAKKQLKGFINDHYNHPSIFSWGVSNEVNGDTDKETYLELKKFVKNLDSSRFTTVVSNRIWQKKKDDETLLFDMPTWNEYIGTWHGKDRNELSGKLDTLKMTLENRPLLITENGLCEPANTGGDARRIDDMLFHIKEWQKKPFVMGYIYFCLSDYRTHMGEEGFGKYKIRRHGITDVNLNPKPSYSVFKQIASPINITKVERISNKDALIQIQVKNDIPSYNLKGYIIKYTNNKNKVVEIKLPMLKPGDLFSTNLIDVNPQFKFKILRPGGFSVIEY